MKKLALILLALAPLVHVTSQAFSPIQEVQICAIGFPTGSALPRNAQVLEALRVYVALSVSSRIPIRALTDGDNLLRQMNYSSRRLDGIAYHAARGYQRCGFGKVNAQALYGEMMSRCGGLAGDVTAECVGDSIRNLKRR